MKMLKDLLKKNLPQNYYYNLLTTHDVIQSMVWRTMAPPIAEEAFQENYQMLFVIGCGRSGTTIFSHCLGMHQDIAELNEPLHIWFATTSKADIVSPFAGLMQGLCRLDRTDVNESVRARYRAMVDYHMKKQEHAPVVCDKLPLNTFRVDYISSICPTAKFILLQRSPRAVARSIEQCVKRDGAWWGFNDYKWRAIRRYAESQAELRHLIPYAIDDYYRGLIEWRVSQHLAKSDLVRLDPARHVTIDYEDFITDPRQVLEKSFAFAGLEPDGNATDYAVAHVGPTRPDNDQSRTSAGDDRLHALILGSDVDQEIGAVA